jgi:hypothetical protein
MKKPTTLLYAIIAVGVILTCYAFYLSSHGQILLFLSDSVRSIENVGLGLTSFALTLLYVCKKYEITRYSDFLLLKAPAHKKDYFVIANLAWFFLIPAGYVYFYFRVWQGEYTAGSIEYTLSQGVFFIVFMSVVLNILLALFIPGPDTETILLKRIRFNCLTRFILELIFFVFILVALLVILLLLVYGDFLSVPATMVLTYVLLSVRARKLKIFEQEYS